MPFNNFDNANFPQGIPDVQILFTGLLLLRPEPASGEVTECWAGIIQDPNHELNIEVTDSNDEPIPIPSGLGPRITAPLDMFVVDSSGTPIAVRGVQKYRATNAPFPGDDSNHRMDFRWTVDLKAFHSGATHSNDPAKVKFDIKLKEGLLYTSRRTDTRRLLIRLRRPNGTERDWNRLAAVVAANIYLEAGHFLALDWNNGTRRWLLNKGGIDGGPYRVLIENEPINDVVHDDLDNHYNALMPIASANRFKLRFFGGSLRASVDAPCMPTVLDGEGRDGT